MPRRCGSKLRSWTGRRKPARRIKRSRVKSLWISPSHTIHAMLDKREANAREWEGACLVCRSVSSIAAIAWCQEASGADAVLRHAIQLHQSGDIAAAISEYRQYLDQVPDNVMARSNLGAALARSGEFEEAIVEYRKALEAQPGNLPVRLNLALAYYKAAEISQAAEELERVLEQQRDRQPVLLLADMPE